MKYRYYIIKGFICVMLILNSQLKGIGQTPSNPNCLAVIGKCVLADTTVVKLRWAPTERNLFYQGLQYGYIVERYVMGTADSLYPISEFNGSKVVLDTSILILDSLGWLEKIDTLNPNPPLELGYGVHYDDSLSIQLNDPESMSELIDYEDQKESRYQLGMLAAELSYEVALYSGLGFIDSSVVPGMRYYYKVSMKGPNPCYGLGEVKTDSSAFVLSPPIILAGQGQAGKVGINFRGRPDKFITYDVERSEDHLNYDQINEDPVLPSPLNEDKPDIFSFIDSVTVEMGLYIYRIRGRDVFGDISPWSDTIHVYNLPPPLGIPASIDSVLHHQEIYTKIYWNFPVEHEDDIEGYRVLRSDSRFGDKDTLSGSALLSVTTREFVDLNPLPSNYYFIQVEDTNGYLMDSWPGFTQFTDTIPPVKPGLPTGLANKKGRVRVHWPANPESDIQGYRVFISNRDTGEYTQLTLKCIPDTVYYFDIELSNLERSTFVKVRAIDNQENLSVLSDPCEISLPDIVPPSAPVIIRAVSLDTLNRISFTPSSSDDILKYEIRRKEKDTPSPFETIGEKQQSSQTIHYNDTIPNSGIAYQYVVFAIDQDGNESPSTVVTLLGPLPTRPAVTINDIKIVYKSSLAGEKAGLVISWDYALYKDLVGFKIYRSMDAEPFVQYAVYNLDEAKGMYDLSSDAISIQGEYRFVDKHVFKTRRYRYQVIAMFADGTISPVSGDLTKVYN